MSKYPTKLDREKLSNTEWIKQRTIELYDYLPQTTLEERFTYTDIRDEVFELNYAFFGYVASHTFINNATVEYEDKFQSACLHWLEMWHKFRFAKKYRTDLSFAVFFKPRVAECMERELNEVKYSVRRDLCMKVGKQLGKHWGQVRYEDLASVDLPAADMAALKAIFGSMYIAELDDHILYIPAETPKNKIEHSYEYDTIEELLMEEMIECESKLDNKYLNKLSNMLDIPIDTLKAARPVAEELLKNKLEEKVAEQKLFTHTY